MNYWNPNLEEQNYTRPARDSERSPHTLDHERSSLSGTAEAPIGVFDSGAGGFTILSALRKELPAESYIYFGDTANCPYGLRTDAEIIDFSTQACNFLVEQGVKLIVVACNTASQAALNSLRATFPSILFVGVVPAVKPAARATKKGRIGIAATNHAKSSFYLQQLIEDFADGIQAFRVGCPELVTLVEQGEIDGPDVEATVEQALFPIVKEDVDVIVLGCTHFPALRPVIERVTHYKIHIIDSGSAVARHTHNVLDTEGLIHPTSANGVHGGILEVWCSGDAGAFSDVAQKLLGYSVKAHRTRF